MKIESLELQYFRQHHHSRVQFSTGLTGIIGPNGAGKSSLIEALLFAFFGSKALRGKVDDARTRGVPRSAHTVVELVWQIDGTSYRVRRELSNAELFLGGSSTPICNGSREVTEQIEVILKMTLNEFTATYLTEQKGLEFLSGQRGAAERERFIGRMMGFDELESIQSLMRDDKRLLKAEIQGAEGVQISKEELTQRVQADEARLSGLVANSNQIRDSLLTNEREEAKLKEELRRLERLREEYSKFSTKVRESEIFSQNRNRRIEELRGQIGVATGDPEALQTKLAAVTAALVEAKKLAADSSNLATSLDQHWREERTKRDTEIRILVGKIKEIEGRAASLAGITSCPTCGQSLKDGTDVKSHFQAELRELNQALFGCRSRRKELEERPQDLLQASAQAELQSAKVQELGRESVATERELNAVQLAQEAYGKLRLFEAEEQKSKVELEKLRSEMGALLFSEESLIKARTSYEAASRLVTVTRLSKVRVDAEVGTVNELLARAREELVRFDERAKELSERKGRFLLLEEGDLLLTAFRKHLSASIRPRLSSIAGEFLAELTDGRYSAIELGEDFVPTVIDDGTPKPVISGGEEDILNICMRLALSSMLAERTGGAFSLLILDEIFGSLDDIRRTNVVNLLERMRGRFEQIIIITHLDDVRDSVQAVIEVAYDEKNGAVLLDQDTSLLAGNF